MRDSIGQLLQSLGMNTELFASVSDFLKSDKPDGPACLVLDVRLPGRSGLEFQRDLAAADRDFPIIFITTVNCRISCTAFILTGHQG